MTGIIMPERALLTPNSSGFARQRDVLTDWKLTPATMMHHLDPSWIPAKWLQYLSFRIATAVARGNCGLLISAPPRHGKSRLSTIGTPLWVLENFPHKNVVVSTYGEELSTDFSREIRDFITNNPGELTVRLRSDTQRVTNFLTTKGGGLKAVGLRGAITGRGADVFVLDDYIKEPKEALSKSYLDDLWTWWLTVARTRLEPGAVVIILATRWVSNDLHGRIIEQQRRKGRNFFEIIELPAIAAPTPDKPDPLGRQPGEVLFPERYNTQAILDIKSDLTSRWFGAMFQQRPEEEEITLISKAWFPILSRDMFADRLRQAQLAGQEILVGRGWDFASTADGGDYTAGALCLYNKVTDELYILDMRRGQFSAAKAEEVLAEESENDQKQWSSRYNYKVGIEKEPGSSGDYAVRSFEKIVAQSAPGTKVVSYRATKAKQLNAAPLLAAAEHHRVWLVDDGTVGPSNPEGTGWIQEFYGEVDRWPDADNDDQIDAVTVAYKMLSGKIFKGAGTFGRKGAKDGAAPATPRAEGFPRSSRATFGRRH